FDHPLRHGFAILRSVFIFLGKVRTVFRISPLSPKQHVTMFKAVRTTALFAPCACAHGTDVVASFFFFTLLGRGSIVPVYSRHVITISTVFSSQLPVTFIGISRRTT